tara:strand:- start:2775 stop:3644 length:870 start_codon:yes stop_codon:yes gene_type:complete
VKILLLGSSGFLGKYLEKYLKKKYKVYTTGKKKRSYNFTNFTKIKKKILNLNPDIIINSAGLTDIEICESKPLLSKKINLNLIENVFNLKIENKLNFVFFHFSTDHMYNPKKNIENNENSKTFKINTYTKHKLLAEKICLQNKALVFRLNLIGKSFSKKLSFTDWIFNAFKNKKIIYGFIDSFYSPLSADTVSKIIVKIISNKNHKKSGIFNIGSKKGISKYQLIKKFAKGIGFFEKRLLKKSKINTVCKTKRSKFNRLKSNKFEKMFKIRLPSTSSEIKQIIKTYNEN